MTSLYNKFIMRYITLSCVLFPLMITGCMGFPVDYPEAEDRFNQNIELLIGSDANTVEKQLGQPTSRIMFYDSIIYNYARTTDVLAVGVGVFHSKAMLCYKLKFDESNQLVDFRRYCKGYSGNYTSKYECQRWLYSRDYYDYDPFYDPWFERKDKPYDPDTAPIPNDYYECDYVEEKAKREKPVSWESVSTRYFHNASEEELTVAAESGNPAARLQLYWNDNEYGLYWLCNAANQGYAKARYRIAQLYEFGDDGVDKNLLHSYMWYDLAAKSCHPWARKDALRVSHDSLSEDQRKEAQKMIDEWTPIDCSSWL